MADHGPLTPGEPQKGRRHDWTTLMYEWARGTESLHAFGKRHGLGPARFMAVVRAMDWRGVRARLRAAAIAKAEPQIIKSLADRYKFQEHQWLTVEAIIARALKKIAGEQDITSLAPEVLESLTRTLERTLKSRKLIRGEATGDAPQAAPGAPQPGMVNHRQVVDLILAMQGKDPRFVLPETVIEAQIVDPETDKSGGKDGGESGGAA